MKTTYECPKIRVKEIKEENELMAAVSGTISISKEEDDGSTPMAGKRNFFSSDEESGSAINWDDEE